MRDLHDVRILRGVTHVVGPRKPGMGLKLSEAELPLDGDVRGILTAHVEGGLGDPQAKAARFVVREDDRACGAFSKLLGSRPRLIELSQSLARSLYSIAEQDDRVSDGTLAILLCQASDENDTVV